MFIHLSYFDIFGENKADGEVLEMMLELNRRPRPLLSIYDPTSDVAAKILAPFPAI